MADRTSSTDLLFTYSVSEQDFNRRFLATIWTLTFDYKSLTVLKEEDKKKNWKAHYLSDFRTSSFFHSRSCFWNLFPKLPRVKSSSL